MTYQQQPQQQKILQYRARQAFDGDASSYQISFSAGAILLAKDPPTSHGWQWAMLANTQQAGWLPYSCLEPMDAMPTKQEPQERSPTTVVTTVSGDWSNLAAVAPPLHNDTNQDPFTTLRSDKNQEPLNSTNQDPFSTSTSHEAGGSAAFGGSLQGGSQPFNTTSHHHQPPGMSHPDLAAGVGSSVDLFDGFNTGGNFSAAKEEPAAAKSTEEFSSSPAKAAGATPSPPPVQKAFKSTGTTISSAAKSTGSAVSTVALKAGSTVSNGAKYVSDGLKDFCEPTQHYSHHQPVQRQVVVEQTEVTQENGGSSGGEWAAGSGGNTKKTTTTTKTITTSTRRSQPVARAGRSRAERTAAHVGSHATFHSVHSLLRGDTRGAVRGLSIAGTAFAVEGNLAKSRKASYRK